MLFTTGKSVLLGLLGLITSNVMAQSSFLVTNSALVPAMPMTTVAVPVRDVIPTTIVQEEEDLNSIIEAEATLDVTADESPEAEILTTIQ